MNHNVYHVRSSLGMPEKRLLFPAWEVKVPINKPIYSANLFRKVFMKEVGQYRLFVNHLETDDEFIIRDLVQLRIQQVTVNQENHKDLYFIDCTNEIGQEMLVSSDHIRWNDAGQPKSAILERNLCDKVPLFKLRPGKSIKIQLKMQK